MEILDRPAWQARADAHAARVDEWVLPHLARRRQGVKHPVHDFLFTYYSQRPAALRRWHPGWGVVLLDAPEYAGLKGYCRTVPNEMQVSEPDPAGQRSGPSLSVEHLRAQVPLVESIHRLLVATASRAPRLGCFGMHEWAMVHRAADADGPRHEWPLRLGPAGTDEIVESHRISCTHFDAYRFFTPSARPLNTLRPGRDDRVDFEQPGCLHAGMDLYGRCAGRLSPLIPSELVADAFELAWDVRILDMRAAPYDFTGLTLDPTGEPWTPLEIETPKGKQDYVAQQRGFADRGQVIRRRLIGECERLLSVG